MKGQPSAGDSESRPDEDTNAILSRRQFLITSSLAGAGIGVAAAGCRPKPDNFRPGNPFFQPCLSIARPRPDPEPPEPNHQDQADPPESSQETPPRFEPFEPDSQNQADAPTSDQQEGRRLPEASTIPQVCLSVSPDPRVCLWVPPSQGKRLPPVP
jgi:hypothetical protein